MSATKPKSALARIKMEMGTEPYYFTDDIVIEAPTLALSEKFEKLTAEDLNAGLRVWFGDELFEKFDAAIKSCEARLVPYLLADLFGHFFGEVTAAKLLDESNRAAERAISEAFSAE